MKTKTIKNILVIVRYVATFIAGLLSKEYGDCLLDLVF